MDTKIIIFLDFLLQTDRVKLYLLRINFSVNYVYIKNLPENC